MEFVAEHCSQPFDLKAISPLPHLDRDQHEAYYTQTKERQERLAAEEAEKARRKAQTEAEREGEDLQRKEESKSGYVSMETDDQGAGEL